MDKITEINTDSGYAAVEPGINFDQFSGALAKIGWRFHITRAPGGASTVGNCLMRSAGSFSTKHLDPLLDLEVVLTDGTVLNTSSAHFPSAGTPVGSGLSYGPLPDAAGLFCSAYDTLEVVAKVAIRICPINEHTKVAVATFDSYADALDFVKDITNNSIPEHSIIWHRQAYVFFGVLAPDLDMDEDPTKAPPGIPYSLVSFFLSGYEESFKANEEASKKVTKKYGGTVLSREDAEALCAESVKVWDHLYLHYRPWLPNVFFGLAKYKPFIVHAGPKNMKELEKWAMQEISNLGIWPVCYYSQPFDFGRSVFFQGMVFADEADKERQKKVGETYDRMLKEARERYGAIPYRRSPGIPLLQESGGYYDFLKKLKRQSTPIISSDPTKVSLR